MRLLVLAIPFLVSTMFSQEENLTSIWVCDSAYVIVRNVNQELVEIPVGWDAKIKLYSGSKPEVFASYKNNYNRTAYENYRFFEAYNHGEHFIQIYEGIWGSNEFQVIDNLESSGEFHLYAVERRIHKAGYKYKYCVKIE